MRHDPIPALFLLQKHNPPHNSTPTNIAAAKAVRATVAQQRGEVYGYFKNAADGLTDEEGYEASGINPNAWRPRRGELVRDGMVVDSGRTRATKSGCKAVVWVVKENGNG